MGKLYDRLQKQLKSKEYKKDAEDCLKIYEKLKEMNDGKVWDSSWNPLTTVKFVGTYPNSERIYKPSQEGYVFLKGIEEKKEREAGVRYIPVQMAIMSHLSDAQECMNFNTGNYPGISRADLHINFAKKLILKYPDTDVEVTDDELNELWKEISDTSFRSKTELIQQCLSDIINKTERVTTGNVSHSVVSIKAMATYCLRIINGEI